MISINLYLAIAVYLSLALGGMLLYWLFSRNKGKEKDLSLEKRHIWFCSVCAYTYINTKEDKISACPRCGSYNEKEIS